jgi:Mg2+ and Co2+ transporter CorA
VAPTSDLQATKTKLEQRSLEILASVAMEKIASLKLNLSELRQRRDRLNSMHRILSGKRQTFEFFAQPEQENIQKINELKALLSETEKEIELARKEVETPDDTLGHLERIMALPAQTFSLRQQSLPLNWMNVIVEDSADTAFHQINLAELSLNEELLRSAVLVRFDR